MTTVFASAPSIEAMTKSVTKFYCGEEKLLVQKSEKEWGIHSEGKEISGVRVSRRGRRFYFEAT